jgi:hypothetical protein
VVLSSSIATRRPRSAMRSMALLPTVWKLARVYACGGPCESGVAQGVMAGLVPAIHVLTEAKSCSEFRAEEVPLLILDPARRGNCHHGSDEQMFGAE